MFASLFNDRAIAYRVHQGFNHKLVALPAGVQRMVRSETGTAGVLFILDTESGYYHPSDFIQTMYAAFLREELPAARDAIAQILINLRMCATGHRPICQDTGIVTVFVKVGMGGRWEDPTLNLDDMINEGVRRAYSNPDNVLRASIVSDPAGKRPNTKDNTPAIIHYSVVAGNELSVDIAAKGGGSENKAKMVMLRRMARKGANVG